MPQKVVSVYSPLGYEHDYTSLGVFSSQFDLPRRNILFNMTEASLPLLLVRQTYPAELLALSHDASGVSPFLFDLDISVGTKYAVSNKTHSHRAAHAWVNNSKCFVAGDESSDAGEITASSAKLPVHLRLGEAPSAVCTSKKKKSKRKRSSRDLSGGAKRKRTKASLDHGPQKREQRWRRKVCSLGPSSP